MRLNKLRAVLGSVVVLGGFSAATSACLSRPVAESTPTTKVSFSTRQKANAVDKIDLLLAIDDSASMADKQKFLAKAVPVLVSRLVTPNCVSIVDGTPNGQPAIVDAANPDGKCADSNFQPEFKAITDIHVGIVTSSMGSFGSTASCDGKGTNTRGHLLSAETAAARTGGITMEDAGFLAYFPTNAKNTSKAAADGYRAPSRPYKDAAALNTAFSSFVEKVGENGCGYEAQLESVYHFLIQPDPWEKITVVGEQATYDGVDLKLLAQRRDFLRSDSLLAVVMLTDENDSSVDPLSMVGRGWMYMMRDANRIFPSYDGSSAIKHADSRYGSGYTIPGGSSKCATSPNDGDCKPCWDLGKRNSDPTCAKTLAEEDDPSDLRFYHMKQRFGWDPQYPIERYVRGFSRTAVPNRGAEHDGNGSYLTGSNGEKAAKCTNPIYAKTLPEPTDDATALCTLPLGSRDPSNVFFAVIGGVPQDLLRDENNNVKAQLTGGDWTKILGANPGAYDYTGIDARMIESPEPRSGATYAINTDKLAGNDWDSRKGDLMYACTFDLPANMQRTGGQPGVDVNSTAFDCSKYWDSPLCNKALRTNDAMDTTPRTQIKGKAYPTTRELRVVQGLGDQGIVASICALKTDINDSNDKDYGYNPAVNAIVDRLKVSLASQCLPEKLTSSAAPGEPVEVPCLILERLREKGPESNCDAKDQGRKIPNEEILKIYIANKLEADPTSDIREYPICEIIQTPVKAGETCETASSPGFCYVSNSSEAKPLKSCQQAIVYASNTFTQTERFQGSTVDLQCISQQ